MPTRLGVRLPLRFESLILVSPSARIIRPKKFDTSRVIKADQLKERVWKDIDNESIFRSVADVAKLVSVDTVLHVARQMVALHKPLRTGAPPQLEAPPLAALVPVAIAAAPSHAQVPSPPKCKLCLGGVGHIQYGQYGYYFKCAGCASNTAVRMTCQPGHKPRLRKQGQSFLRECGECGVSQVYFQNP
jgi:hypothetical protein